MKLIFVYNTGSGKLNALLDIAHKIIRPDTYECALCNLTHDAFSEKEAWKNYKETTQIEMQFCHKDKFEEEYKQSFAYPVILKQSGKIEEVITADKIRMLKDVDELIQLLEEII